MQAGFGQDRFGIEGYQENIRSGVLEADTILEI